MKEKARAEASEGGALGRELLDRPVVGRNLIFEGAGTSVRLGDVIGTGETLLVFLRHLG